MTQPTALFLADILEDAGKPADIAEKCATELRRLHAENTELREENAELRAWFEVESGQLKRAVVAEREACAKVCDAIAHEEIGMAYEGIALDCAATIRARRDKQ